MTAVGAEFRGEAAMLVGQGGMVIHIDDVMGIGILPQPLVNVDDGLGGILITSAEAENSRRGLEDRGA